MAIRIVCIKKDDGNYENPYVAISLLSWVNDRNGETGLITRDRLYDWIHDDKGIAYIDTGNKKILPLEAKISYSGDKYVKAIDDCDNVFLNFNIAE